MKSVSVKLQGIELEYFASEILETYEKVDDAIAGKSAHVTEVDVLIYQYYFTELRTKLHRVKECLRLNKEMSLPVKPGYLVLLKRFFLCQDSVIASMIIAKIDNALVNQLKLSN